jgi:hypothetical protein
LVSRSEWSGVSSRDTGSDQPRITLFWRESAIAPGYRGEDMADRTESPTRRNPRTDAHDPMFVTHLTPEGVIHT